MVLQPDQQRVSTMLKDTITLLCKSGLDFKKTFHIEAVIGVTLDDQDMFHISMSEIVKSDEPVTENSRKDRGDDKIAGHNSKRKRRKRPGIKHEANDNGEQSDEQSDGASSHGLVDDVESANQVTAFPSPIKRTHTELIKGDPDISLAGDDSGDIIVIKQEVDDSWSQSCSEPSYSGTQFSASHLTPQDQNFSSLSDVTLMPVTDHIDRSKWSASMNMWGPPNMSSSTVVRASQGDQTGLVSQHDQLSVRINCFSSQ